MTVYVIMGNDYPSAVFDDKTLAETYIARMKEESERAGAQIYWRAIAFDLNRGEA